MHGDRAVLAALTHGRDGAVDYPVDIENLMRKPELSRLDSRQIEQLVDSVGQFVAAH